MHACIYIYIEREREKKRGKETCVYACVHVCLHTYVQTSVNATMNVNVHDLCICMCICTCSCLGKLAASYGRLLNCVHQLIASVGDNGHAIERCAHDYCFRPAENISTLGNQTDL